MLRCARPAFSRALRLYSTAKDTPANQGGDTVKPAIREQVCFLVCLELKVVLLECARLSYPIFTQHFLGCQA